MNRLSEMLTRICEWFTKKPAKPVDTLMHKHHMRGEW